MTQPERGDLRFGTTLGVLGRAVADWPDHPAIEDTATGTGQRTLSFSELALEVERQYGSAGLDPEHKSALIDFRMEDAEEFIL